MRDGKSSEAVRVVVVAELRREAWLCGGELYVLDAGDESRTRERAEAAAAALCPGASLRWPTDRQAG